MEGGEASRAGFWPIQPTPPARLSAPERMAWTWWTLLAAIGRPPSVMSRASACLASALVLTLMLFWRLRPVVGSRPA